MGDEPDARVRALLSELCVRYGYCLSPDAQNTLLAEPPHEPDAFIDAVLPAEGRDPMLGRDFRLRGSWRVTGLKNG